MSILHVSPFILCEGSTESVLCILTELELSEVFTKSKFVEVFSENCRGVLLRNLSKGDDLEELGNTKVTLGYSASDTDVSMSLSLDFDSLSLRESSSFR
jgi:hypothetical protein